ncbi:hypothetical protein [Pseudoalteromonas sp. SR44-2]|uniref:hypothetical protein n=1 Tax=Pseudoalteromonas sp. SR44-2 TaxID=2760937 RepID=UPI001600FF02|nr:hypothetical protein [Pseudoalteromonas sp. SR44-2]MBB1337690.1 hypothetical protein [Pseudoalteromonas sp. SR44-2]
MKLLLQTVLATTLLSTSVSSMAAYDIKVGSNYDSNYAFNSDFSRYVTGIHDGICIGGELCGAASYIRLLQSDAWSGNVERGYFGTLEITAHDQVGDKTRAKLLVLRSDGTKIAERDVKRAGSVIKIDIDEFDYYIQLKSIGKDGTDETVIQKIRLY